MRSVFSFLLLAAAVVGMAGCYTCDVCDDCGDPLSDAHYGVYQGRQPACSYCSAHAAEQMAPQVTAPANSTAPEAK